MGLLLNSKRQVIGYTCDVSYPHAGIGSPAKRPGVSHVLNGIVDHAYWVAYERFCAHGGTKAEWDKKPDSDLIHDIVEELEEAAEEILG